ncbi:hypothetical protein CCH79_00007864 [Gambusia affinis]|uniref:Ig-like domain-containing protein n=1 Tax=Gambusia affinis TaxID=33528 RepID=A0A315W1W3_GAMAF|nr:hypothetical protein CCH79_00007864 [Gambusia affinis]
MNPVFILSYLAGVSLCVEVSQSPSDLITRAGYKVQIFCTYDKTDYRVTLWYQRPAGDSAMNLLGYLSYKDATMEETYKKDFNISGDLSVNTLKNASLTISAAEEKHSAFYFCAASFSLGIDIHQFPSNIVSNASDDVQLFCSHNQSSYRVVLWYQKTPGDQALNLIGYGYGQISNDSVEETFRKHFRLGGDLAAAKKNLSLSIVGLKAEHTATYFCAAREAHCAKHPAALNKNLQPTASCYLLSESRQSPAAITSRHQISSPGDNVTFECRLGTGHSMGSQTMLWYRQRSHGAQMEFILKEYEETVGHFSISAVNFQQLPSVFVRDGDESVTLWCDQDNNQNYYMFWYRHPAGSGKMELVAYSVGKDAAAVEDPFSKTKYTMTRPEVLRTSLQIHSPEAADSAVYYCASSLAQCFRLPQPPNNNLRRRQRPDQGGKTLKNLNATDVNNFNPAYFGPGTKVTVLDETPVTPPTVKILQTPKCQDKDGNVKNKTLVCVASGFYPDHVGVSWTRNDLKITDGVSTDAAARRGKDNYYKITSRLTIPNTDSIKPNIRFKCIVSFYNGTANIEKDDVFTTKRTLIPGMTRANYLKITQNAKLSYSALIVKSLLYAALVGLLVWKLQVGPETENVESRPNMKAENLTENENFILTERTSARTGSRRGAEKQVRAESGRMRSHGGLQRRLSAEKRPSTLCRRIRLCDRTCIRAKTPPHTHTHTHTQLANARFLCQLKLKTVCTSLNDKQQLFTVTWSRESLFCFVL